jgi:hypothetical protein
MLWCKCLTDKALFALIMGFPNASQIVTPSERHRLGPQCAEFLSPGSSWGNSTWQPLRPKKTFIAAQSMTARRAVDR